MTDSSIAKNTFLLYVRMFLTLLLGLWTSRLVLNGLGETDYGIYNVVGGVVAIFSSVSSTLSTAISRFITFELGKPAGKVKEIYSLSIIIQVGLSLLIVLFVETFGLWFLNSKMNIPLDRMDAANVVLQIAAVSFVAQLLIVPYNAMLVAKENFQAFAIISLADSFVRFLIGVLLSIDTPDKLIFYTVLMGFWSIISLVAYAWYCRRKYEEVSFIWTKDLSLFKRLFGFAGWNFIGVTAGVLRLQGNSILCNLFFGPSVNAARAIATQVNGAVSQFATSFTTAINPRIIKSYAANEYGNLRKLMYYGSKYSCYLLLLIALPIIINADFIMELWLGNVPLHSILFLRLMIVYTMSEVVSYPLITAMLATGNIKKYQIVVGGCLLLNLPISYLLLKIGLWPEIVEVVSIAVSQLCLLVRLIMLSKIIEFSLLDFIYEVYARIVLVIVLSSAGPVILSIYIGQGWLLLVTSSILSILMTLVVVWLLGLKKEERLYFLSLAKNITYDKHHK